MDRFEKDTDHWNPGGDSGSDLFYFECVYPEWHQFLREDAIAGPLWH